MSRTKKIVLLVLLVLAVAGPIAWGLLTREEKPVLRVMIHTTGGDEIRERSFTEYLESPENDVYVYTDRNIIPFYTETRKSMEHVAYFFDLYSDRTLIMSVGAREITEDMAAEQSLRETVTTYTKVLSEDEFDTFLGYTEEAFADTENTLGPMHEDDYEPYVYFYYKNECRIWPFIYAHTKPRHELRYMLRSFFPDEIDCSLYVVKSEIDEQYYDGSKSSLTTSLELLPLQEAYGVFER